MGKMMRNAVRMGGADDKNSQQSGADLRKAVSSGDGIGFKGSFALLRELKLGRHFYFSLTTARTNNPRPGASLTFATECPTSLVGL